MADEIVIKTVLDLSGSEQRLRQQIEKALGSPEGQTAAKNAGKKIGDALGAGIETTRKTREDKELAHMRKLEGIAAQSNARLVQIEARKQAQIDTIRERAAQKEISLLKRIEAQAIQSAKNIGNNLSRISSALSNIGGKLTLGLTAPLAALGIAAIKTATDFDSLKRGLTSVSGSSAETEKQLLRLKEVAKLPGLGFKEAIQGSINLQAAGLSAERAEKALRVFGNALATVGKGKAELDGVILALSQIESKGKVSAEEINQLAERVPQIRKAMIAAFGTADTEVIQRAKITSGKFIDAVVTELDKLPKVTGGARNAFENLKDSIEQSLLPLGNKLLETILPAIERLSPKVLGLLESFGKLSPTMQNVVLGFGAAALAAGPLLTALASLTNAVIALNAASSTGLMARLLTGPVILTAAIVGTTAVQTFREATGNEEMIDRIGGPDLNKISAIMKQRGISGADAFMRVAQELKDNALLAGLPRAEGRQPLAGEEAFRLFGGGRPAIDAVAIAKTNAAAAKAARAGKAKEPEDLLSPKNVQRRAEPSLAETLARQQKAIDDHIDIVTGAALEGISADRKAQLEQGRLTRANLTEDFEKRTKAQEKFNEELKESIKLAQEMDPSFRFMKGLRGETDQVASSFERLGQRIGDAFGDFKNLLGSLASAVKQFFSDILSATLRTAVASVLGPLLGGAGGGSFGNIFRSLSSAGGISTPASVSSGGGIGGFFSNIFGGGGGTSGSAGSVAGAAATGGGFSFGGLLGGLAGAAPLLGLGLGAGFGGQSVGGQILGAIGGGAVGLGASFGASVFAAGGGLAQAGLAALGPIGLIGIPLLIGASLLGKAKQRRADEEASGQMLTQALQGIEQIAQAVSSGQIRSLGEARGVFENNILGTFRQQISGLKTRSVVESRLKNQVADLRNVFESRIPPLIDQQAQLSADAARRAAIDARLIPQFASGGTTMGGLALVHAGEKIVNFQQQSAMRAIGGPDIFERAGVPGPSQNRNFDIGGTMGSGGGGGQPINITFGEVRFVISSKTAEGIYIAGARSDTGRAITVDNFKQARVNREV
jgi:tape measure domain-containing protein